MPKIDTSLYQLTQNYLNVIDMLDSVEEDTDLFEAVKETLDAINDDIDDKAENICKVMANLEAVQLAKKTEAKRLKDEASVLDNRIENIKKYLIYAMKISGKNKIDKGAFQISIRESPSAPVEILIPENEIPTEYANIKVEPNKTAIRDAMKAGAVFDWARFGEKKTIITIK